MIVQDRTKVGTSCLGARLLAMLDSSNIRSYHVQDNSGSMLRFYTRGLKSPSQDYEARQRRSKAFNTLYLALGRSSSRLAAASLFERLAGYLSAQGTFPDSSQGGGGVPDFPETPQPLTPSHRSSPGVNAHLLGHAERMDPSAGTGEIKGIHWSVLHDQDKGEPETP